MTEYSDSDFQLFFEEIRSAAAEFSTAFAATQLFLNLSFFPPLRILSHLNFYKQWVMSIFCIFFVVNSYADFFNVEPACLLKAPSSVVGELDEKTKLDALNSLSVDYLCYLEKRLSHSFKK